MDSARNPGRSTMRTEGGIHLVVGVNDGTEYGVGDGMDCDRGRSLGCGRYRRAVRLVLVASCGVECCFGTHNLQSRLYCGASRSVAAVMDCTDCRTSRSGLGNGDEGWALEYTLFLINSEYV